ncbi:MAG TPA: dienelactone hydrolase family protein [Nitrososphaeraceae archaeon]|nr:dienelactone hydrolase family protein [Nitrososphaeraceae archaeon]
MVWTWKILKIWLTDTLAKKCYFILASDLFNGQVTKTPDVIQTLVSSIRENNSETTSNLQNIGRYLAALEKVNSIFSSLGWCFGNGQSVQLAINT